MGWDRVPYLVGLLGPAQAYNDSSDHELHLSHFLIMRKWQNPIEYY